MYTLVAITTAVILDIYQSIKGVYSGLSLSQRAGMAVKDIMCGAFWPITFVVLGLAYAYHGQNKVLEYLNPHLTGKL
jgi:uncharacterized membrane protein YpjA